MRSPDLDDRDRAILRELMRDGRLTNADLAERVNLSASACLRRVRMLEDSGLVAGYVMLLDPEVAGLPGAAFVSVTLDQQGRATLDRFEAEARRYPEIMECDLLAGSADYLLRIADRDAREECDRPGRGHRLARDRAGYGGRYHDRGGEDRGVAVRNAPPGAVRVLDGEDRGSGKAT